MKVVAKIILAGVALWSASTRARTEEDLPTAVAGKLAPPDSVKPVLAKTLAPEAFSVKDAEGNTTANLWVRAAVPVSAADEPPQYNTIEEGTFVGVLQLLNDSFTDFRDQHLSEGVYTLRLGIQPSDGNHMGVAPFPEFLCLIPAADDVALDSIGHDDLMKISKKASGTGHPAVMFLQPFFEKPTAKFPLVNLNEASNIVLNVMTKAVRPDDSQADFPIGLIIVGTTTAE